MSSCPVPPNLKNFINLEISFGRVPVGTRVVKTQIIKNTSRKCVNYIVTRSTSISPLYYVFEINKYEAAVRPNEDLILKITYSPNIPRSKNYDSFKIIDSEDNFYRLNLTGYSIGPSVHFSVRYLNFFQFPSNNALLCKKKVVQLSNSSEVPVIFQFDCNEEEQGVFHVNKVRGTLKPKEFIFLTITYRPEVVPKVYHRQLWCLILYHEPLALNLLGVHFEQNWDQLTHKYFKYYQFPWSETVGYKGYLSDSVKCKLAPPPVSLSDYYLDFGRIMPNSSCRTLTTSFTNHMPQEVEVDWEKSKLFKIYPEKLVVPAGKSALYECTFNPDFEDRLYTAIINGHVNWTSNSDMLDVPLSLSLRLIGNSFPKNHLWIPTITIIPSTVILPLTLPGHSSWATFMIKSEGHLPVLFKLVPPKKTNFIMKPMIGLLRTDYQIVVVELEICNAEGDGKFYVEKWNLELNGQANRLLPIYVKAQTDEPHTVFGNDNTIYFDKIQPGCQVYTYIPIKNNSSCHLQYESFITESFGMDPMKSELAPSEETFGVAWYTSKIGDEGAKYLEISCKIHCLFNNNLIGQTYDCLIKIHVEAVSSELCAMPPTSQLGEVGIMSTVKTNFYLFNFGESNINFKLFHNLDQGDVVLYPECSNCGPREKIMISVEFRVPTVGENVLIISYKNRQNQFTDNVLNEAAKQVYTIFYNCIYPTIQIVDLLEHNYGYLFNKMALWQFFQIDLINSALSEIVTGEKKRIKLTAPEGGISDETFYVIFQVKNTTITDTEIKLKRRKLCFCEAKEVTPSLTFRQKVYSCPHKEVFTMEISDSSILANSTQTITFKIKHVLQYKNIMSYVIELSNNRSIILEVVVNTIPKDEPKLSIFSHTLNFGEIYIGLREGPIFAFWVCNNTDFPTHYKVSDEEIVKLCNFEDFQVLKCLNPENFVDARTVRPILFRFWPIQVKTYEIRVSLKLGSIRTVLHITGQGIDKIEKCNFANLMSASPNSVKNGPISLSVDRFIVEPILVRSSTERLLFIRNESKTHEIKYAWKPFFIDGLVLVETANNEGTLKPEESHMVVVKITSLNEPCSITLPFSCEFYKNAQKLLISLSVTVTVIGIVDRDTCISAEDQMKQKPFDGVLADVDKFLKDYKEKTKIKERPIHPLESESEQSICEEEVIDREITQYVLDSAVGDAVFSDYFREILRNLKNEPSPFYSQFKSGRKNEEDTVKLVIRPQLPEAGDICQEALLEGLNATLKQETSET